MASFPIIRPPQGMPSPISDKSHTRDGVTPVPLYRSEHTTIRSTDWDHYELFVINNLLMRCNKDKQTDRRITGYDIRSIDLIQQSKKISQE